MLVFVAKTLYAKTGMIATREMELGGLQICLL